MPVLREPSALNYLDTFYTFRQNASLLNVVTLRNYKPCSVIVIIVRKCGAGIELAFS